MLLHLSYKNFLARKITKFYLYNSIFTRKYFLAVEIFTGKCFLASAKPPSTAPKCPGGAKRPKTALLSKKPCNAFKSNGLQNRAKNFKNLPESQFFGFVNTSLSTPITYQSSPKFLPYFYQNRPRWSLPGFSLVDGGGKVRRVPLLRYAPRGRKSGTKSCHFDLFVYFCSVARWEQWIRDCL